MLSASPSLGRLTQVSLREVWLGEANHFTPWLAQEDNLKLLGDTIGLELELESTEQFVGPFRADIVCKHTIDNSWVLIENQLERTDHSHLGQLLTYAAGLDAVTIVWIAERFTNEHRAALDWLNEVTDENINFFGLEIELWRIGESAPAPKFNIISQPNDWTKQVTASRQAQSSEPSEGGQLKLEFWTAFQRYLQDNNSFLKSQKPSHHYWTNFALGRSNFQLSAFIGMRDGYLGLSVITDSPDAKAYYHLLAQERADIEAQIGETLDWREMPTNKQSSISLFWNGVDPTDSSQWPIHHQWLKEKLEAFHRTFAPRIKTLNAANYIPHTTETLPNDPLQ